MPAKPGWPVEEATIGLGRHQPCASLALPLARAKHGACVESRLVLHQA
jgi:hypothetical protein